MRIIKGNKMGLVLAAFFENAAIGFELRTLGHVYKRGHRKRG